jgi:hypothetical protein
VTRFLRTDGPGARIYCRACPKHTRMDPGLHGEITQREIAYYKRIHVCGQPGEPWDIEPHAAGAAEEAAS